MGRPGDMARRQGPPHPTPGRGGPSASGCGKAGATEGPGRAEVAAMAVSYQPENVDQDGHWVEGTGTSVKPGERVAYEAEKK